MKFHYFNQEKADSDDYKLQMCIAQGYVPNTCLLAGSIVWMEINHGKDPCKGCDGPREKCKGRPKDANPR